MTFEQRVMQLVRAEMTVTWLRFKNMPDDELLINVSAHTVERAQIVEIGETLDRIEAQLETKP